LGSGDTFGGLAAHYKVGVSTTRQIVLDVCTAINQRLGSIVLKKPIENDWRLIADRFETICNFPFCTGAIDGKHVAITVICN
jgi:hypothetical protein